MSVSVVVRTYNEERHLPDLLKAIAAQQLTDGVEVVVVDSGSTDRTLEIARVHGARVVPISRHDFSFGRSLNLGCEAASGELLVFVSGHCVPTDNDWLSCLTAPLRDGRVSYCYGRQVGGPATKFSEHQLFAKYYPAISRIPQNGFFCNNANSALRRDVWQSYRFNEDLTGLEDLDLGRRLVSSGHRLGYVAEAAVYHYHHETWAGIRRRYEREAIALQHIMPEVHLTLTDFLRYVSSAILLDLKAVVREPPSLRLVPEIFLFRLMQFWGAYRGNQEHRELSQQRKEHYFYPR